MAKLTNANEVAPYQKAIEDLNAPSENERRLAQVIEFVLRYRLVTQAVITFAAIVSGYALASFIRNGALAGFSSTCATPGAPAAATGRPRAAWPGASSPISSKPLVSPPTSDVTCSNRRSPPLPKSRWR